MDSSGVRDGFPRGSYVAWRGDDIASAVARGFNRQEARQIVQAVTAWRTRRPRSVQPNNGQRRRPTPRAPRSRRTRTSSASRDGPSDEPEPPLGRAFTPDERRGIRNLIDRARRAQLASVEDWRLCTRCLREQEPEEFSRGAKYCRRCECRRLDAYRRRKLVAT
jgi:hypothetical protein